MDDDAPRDANLRNNLQALVDADRGAEQRHHTVAGELVDRALEAGDAVRAAAGQLGHHGAQALGIELLGRQHRADNVGEQV